MVMSRLRVSICQWGMLIGFTGYTLFACANGSTSAYGQDVFVTVTSQPVNVGDAKLLPWLTTIRGPIGMTSKS